MSRFRFIDAAKAAYPVARLCRVLTVSRAGYYAWARRALSARARAAERLTEQIQAAHARRRATDGAPRVHAALAADGVRVGRTRVARLMRTAGLAGCRRGRRPVRTTVADPTASPAANLVARDVTATAPARLWVGDSTAVPTEEGWRSVAVLLDASSRRVVGVRVADHRRTEVALAALLMALTGRRPPAGGR